MLAFCNAIPPPLGEAADKLFESNKLQGRAECMTAKPG